MDSQPYLQFYVMKLIENRFLQNTLNYFYVKLQGMVYYGIAMELGCLISLVMFLKSDQNFTRLHERAYKIREKKKSSVKLLTRKKSSLTFKKQIHPKFQTQKQHSAFFGLLNVKYIQLIKERYEWNTRSQQWPALTNEDSIKNPKYDTILITWIK